MNQDKQPEALRIANSLQKRYDLFPLSDEFAAVAELNRQHARIAELEAELAALKAAPADWHEVVRLANVAISESTGAPMVQDWMSAAMKVCRHVASLLAAPAPQVVDTVRHVVLKEGIPVCAVTKSGAIVGTSDGVTWTASKYTQSIDDVAASAKGGV